MTKPDRIAREARRLQPGRREPHQAGRGHRHRSIARDRLPLSRPGRESRRSERAPAEVPSPVSITLHNKVIFVNCGIVRTARLYGLVRLCGTQSARPRRNDRSASEPISAPSPKFGHAPVEPTNVDEPPRCSTIPGMKGYANPQLLIAPRALAAELERSETSRPLVLDLRPAEALHRRTRSRRHPHQSLGPQPDRHRSRAAQRLHVDDRARARDSRRHRVDAGRRLRRAVRRPRRAGVLVSRVLRSSVGARARRRIRRVDARRNCR